MKQVPLTPITGTLLVRNSRARLDKFFDEMGNNFPARYEKTLFIPIDVPAKLARAMRSAASRALGPDGDHQEKSGVEMIMRSIGGRGATPDDILEEEDKPQTEAPDDLAVPAVNAVDSDEEEEDKDDDEVDHTTLEGLPIESMNRKQLKGLFGREALSMVGTVPAEGCVFVDHKAQRPESPLQERPGAPDCAIRSLALNFEVHGISTPYFRDLYPIGRWHA